MQNQKSSYFLHKTFLGKITGHLLDQEWQLPNKLLLENPGLSTLRTKLNLCHQTFINSKERAIAFQSLENFLTELNLYSLKPKQRFLLLEAARKVLALWHTMVLEGTSNFEEAPLFIALETLLSQNYLHTLDAWIKRGVFLHQPSFVRCIQRVIDALFLARFWYAILGEPQNPNFWKPINTLYQFSEQHQLHKRLCFDRTKSWFYTTTIQKSFLKICLFEISRPQKLSLEERIQLLAFLERKAGFAKVKKYFSDDALFVVDLREAHPPTYQAIHPVKPQGLWRAIDPNPLLTLFQTGNSASETLSSSLVRRLTKYWAVSSGRLPKIPSFSQTKVILGLPNLYALTHSPETAPPTIQTCELTHMRPGSYCLSWHNKGKTGGPKRGDVMGIEYLLQNQSLYCVGVIRWLKRKSEEQYQMGVQVIAPTFLGVQLILSTCKFCCKALLLPNLRGDHQPMTLLTPRIILPSEENVTLRVENKNYVIQLTRLLHSTHQYHHYTFKMEHASSLETLTINGLKVS